MPYTLLWNVDVTLALALPILWLAVLWRLRARGRAPVAITLALAVTAARVASVATIAGAFGARFVDHALLIGLPAAVLPALAMAWLLRFRGSATAAARLRAAADAALIGSFIAVVVVLLQVYDPRPAATALALAAVAGVGVSSYAARSITGHTRRKAAVSIVALTVAGAGVGSQALNALSRSRPAGTYAVTDHDHHAHHVGASGVAGPGVVSVADLTGPRTGAPDRRFTLTARTSAITLPAGTVLDALAFNGQVPGPQLRVRQGDLVQVELRNTDVDAGVTLHWHGIDVPNAEDGVPGVTQDAVPPGGHHVYRFTPPRAGTFWYHSHHVSSEQVARGLFGVIVVEPRQPADTNLVDLALPVHTWDRAGSPTVTIGAAETLQRRHTAPGTRIRLRLLNTDSATTTLAATGTAFRVAATDGNDIHLPTDLPEGTRLPIPAGDASTSPSPCPTGPSTSAWQAPTRPVPDSY